MEIFSSNQPLRHDFHLKGAMQQTKPIPTKNIIIYADDDRDDRELVAEAFNKYAPFIEVVEFINGAETIQYLQTLSAMDPAPCLIILDVNMPKMSGKEALTKIRLMERFSNTPAILFTTSSQPADKLYAEQFGAGFISKPQSYADLKDIARQFASRCTDDVKTGLLNAIALA
ncbi:MAG: response regulator [Bacteroidota bacterium]